MKKAVILILCLAAVLALCACGAVEESVEVFYEIPYTLENEVFEKYDKVIWETEDAMIAQVKDGVVTGKEPGETVITASANDKVIATYHVTVRLKEVTGIVLSTNNVELTEGEETSLSYTLFPEDASDYGLSWLSADPSVATVDSKGKVTAVAPGQTSVTLSTKSGVIASATVIVNMKPAYDRLSDKERAFVDAMLSNITKFKKPDSVKVLAIEFMSGTWYVKISATNGFGGSSSSTYWMMKDTMVEWDVSIKHDSDYDLELINEAIKDKMF